MHGERVGIVMVAAGQGRRCGTHPPKQHLLVGAQPVWALALSHLRDLWPEAPVALVVDTAHHSWFEATLACREEPGSAPILLTAGGVNRQASVLAGLEALQEAGPETVLVHDAVRPLLPPAVGHRLMEARCHHEAVVPVLPIADSVIRLEAYPDTPDAAHSVSREGLHAVQTPQAFAYATLLRLHRRAAAQATATRTDDASLFREAGLSVASVAGDPRMLKITTPADLALVRACSQPDAGEAAGRRETRSGTGFDVHRLQAHPSEQPQEARVMRLGGIDIPSTSFLRGHSDADVMLHALCDALLGALGAGDIGTHFPPEEARHRNADSAGFVDAVMQRMHRRDARLVHADLTFLGEAPRLHPYRAAMRWRIAALLGCATTRVNIKATTSEKLGFLGREEGVAAQATVTITLPNGPCAPQRA